MLAVGLAVVGIAIASQARYKAPATPIGMVIIQCRLQVTVMSFPTCVE